MNNEASLTSGGSRFESPCPNAHASEFILFSLCLCTNHTEEITVPIAVKFRENAQHSACHGTCSPKNTFVNMGISDL